MLQLSKEELKALKKIKIPEKKIQLSRFLLIAFLFGFLILVIMNLVSSSSIFIGLMVGILIYETGMLRYNNTSDLLRIIQKYLK